jgi:hypothetical protein
MKEDEVTRKRKKALTGKKRIDELSDSARAREAELQEIAGQKKAKKNCSRKARSCG